MNDAEGADRLPPLPFGGRSEVQQRYAAVIAAIAEGRRPDAMRDDEAAVHDFCVGLHNRKAVSDATWAHALALFGEKGVVDLLGINGYYTFLSMVMNGARTPALPSSVAPLADPAR